MKIDDFKNKLRELVNNRQRNICTNEKNHLSAVLIPMKFNYSRSLSNPVNSFSLVFIRRSEKLANHPGNIAFPGGHKDPDDSTLVETAIREAHEEIALERENIEIIGLLDDEETITSNFAITPVLASVKQLKFKAQKEEVSEIIEIPLTHLLAPENNKPACYEYDGRQYHLTDYFFENRKIWGATSRILTKLLHLIKDTANS
ncbi:MAG: CoA pyrophosphatase [Planctomycetes bacterium]|nr:CoA pyrophosphatase [Planctomycetota bacterium]